MNSQNEDHGPPTVPSLPATRHLYVEPFAKAPAGTVVLTVAPEAAPAVVAPPILVPAELYHSKTPLIALPSPSVTTDLRAGVAELMAEVERQWLTAAVAYVYRAHPALAAMREAIRSGRFGEPVQVVAVSGQHFPLYRPAYRDIYYKDRATGGGAVQDALTHVLNAAEWLVGPVTRLAADVGNRPSISFRQRIGPAPAIPHDGQPAARPQNSRALNQRGRGAKPVKGLRRQHQVCGV